MPANTNLSYPPFTTAKAGGPIRNNGGVLFFGGSVANPLNASINYLGYRSGFSENLPPKTNSTNIGVVAGLAGGSWQKMEAGKYIMLTYTQRLAGTNNTMLNSPSSYGQKGGQNFISGKIHTNSYIMGGGWYYQTGKPVHEYDQLDTIGPEAYPGTRAIPGRLFFISHGPAKDSTALAVDYKPKTD